MVDQHTTDRFLAKVDQSEGREGCWLWKGRLYEGYGSFSIAGKGMKAHRASLIISGVSVAPRMHVDHMCRNRACVNPEHLRVVSARINSVENSVSVTAINRQKTHCSKGHELAGDNLTASGLKRGWRVCALCQNARNAAYKERVKKRLIPGASA